MIDMDSIGAWVERTPPFSWAAHLNRWLARHLVDPWLNPLMRPFRHRYALRRMKQLEEIRTLLIDTGTTATVGLVDRGIAAWRQRANETA